MDVLLEAQRTAKRRQRRDYVSESAAGSLLFGLDAALTLLVLVVGFLLAGRGTAPGGWAPAMSGSLAVFPFTKYLFGLYPGHGLTRAQRLRQAVLSAGTGLALYLGVAWGAERLGGVRLQVSQAAGALVLAALAVLSDAVGRRLLIRVGRWHQPVFIFGGGDVAREVARQLVLYPHLGYRPACIVDDGSVYIPDEEHGVPVIRFKELSRHADQLGLASTAVVIERLAERSLILQLYTAGIFKHILLVPDCHDLISLRSSVRRVGGTLSIRVASDRPSRLAAFGKRAFDLGAGGLALVLLSPLLVTLAVAVRLDGEGPVIFSQPRWGGGDGTFRALKFRTMHTDGERRLRRHFLHNPAAEREYERYRKLDDDPRVTRVGRIMRATSLDELPQLVNVMRGEMSLVGPRPYTLDELSRLGPARQILSVALPGITGFWQVSGRNQRTFRERIEMDCYYVRNLSIWLDLWILYRTVIGVITREGK